MSSIRILGCLLCVTPMTFHTMAEAASISLACSVKREFVIPPNLGSLDASLSYLIDDVATKISRYDIYDHQYRELCDGDVQTTRCIIDKQFFIIKKSETRDITLNDGRKIVEFVSEDIKIDRITGRYIGSNYHRRGNSILSRTEIGYCELGEDLRRRGKKF